MKKYFYTENPFNVLKIEVGQACNLSITRVDNKTALDYLREGYIHINTYDKVRSKYELERVDHFGSYCRCISTTRGI